MPDQYASLRDAQLRAAQADARAAQARAVLARAEAEHHQALAGLNRAIDALIVAESRG